MSSQAWKKTQHIVFLTLIAIVFMLYGCGETEDIVTGVEDESSDPQPDFGQYPDELATPTVFDEDKPMISGEYLMAFHACDSFSTNCMDPRNHLVFIAESNDGQYWNLVPGWQPYFGSVPDIIRRGDTLYIYTGPTLVRYHFETHTLESIQQIEIEVGEMGAVIEPVMPTDPSIILDDQGRFVMFFMYGQVGSDPAGCPPGEQSCVKYIGSATEIDGSDGTQFLLDANQRIGADVGPATAFMSFSDPDIVTDGRDYYLFMSHGSWISVWSSPEMRGKYLQLNVSPMGFLTTGSGGVPSGFYHQESGEFWTYAHVRQNEGSVIRRAVHKDLVLQLEEGDWITVITGESIGLGLGYDVESPSIIINTP